ncbi:MAG: hypothetical protein AAGA26_11330 [Pseudomonadota bacterium]
MTRHENIDPAEATAVAITTSKPQTYAEQVRELEELYAQGRREMTSWTVSLPYFKEGKAIASYGLAFGAGTIVLTAIVVGLIG